MTPAVGLLVIWMIVPLALTLWYSFQGYNLLSPPSRGFVGLSNYTYLLTDPSLPIVIWNTILLVIAVVIMLETIFFLAIYAEILVTTVGGPGLATTNLPFFIYSRALLAFDVGGASAGGIIAIVLANIVAFFFVRAIARDL